MSKTDKRYCFTVEQAIAYLKRHYQPWMFLQVKVKNGDGQYRHYDVNGEDVRLVALAGGVTFCGESRQASVPTTEYHPVSWKVMEGESQPQEGTDE